MQTTIIDDRNLISLRITVIGELFFVIDIGNCFWLYYTVILLCCVTLQVLKRKHKEGLYDIYVEMRKIFFVFREKIANRYLVS